MKSLLKIKKFTTEEYFLDYKYITNSHLSAFRNCPYFYNGRRKGKIQVFDKDYFDYGKGVDTILSREDIREKFYIGSAIKKTSDELETEINELDNEMSEREKTGKKPLKASITKFNKLKEQIELAKEADGKIQITETKYEHIKQSAEELQGQPLYNAFGSANTQTIIAVEINGVKVKCMLDKLDLKNKIICDDKSTKSLVNTDFNIYLQQLAWYRWIVFKTYGVLCDCYLAVVDKNESKNLPFKRSSLFYAPPAKLDYQEELNQEQLEVFLKARKDNNYPPCTENNPEAREEKCFGCDHYPDCPHSLQKEFIIL